MREERRKEGRKEREEREGEKKGVKNREIRVHKRTKSDKFAID